MSYKDLSAHCYMQDVYPEIEDIARAGFTNALKVDDRRVGGLKYRDPDGNCRKLYEDEIKYFFEENGISCSLLTRETNYGGVSGEQYLIKPMTSHLQKPVYLSSDYLGPSTTAAFHVGLPDEYVWEAMLKCRTIGGHITWPCISGGINGNKARSGNKNSGISDRMDIALYEVKNFLQGKNGEERYNTDLWTSFEDEMTAGWLRSFDPSGSRIFEAFCDFFKLKGSFVDENYQIVWMAPKVMGKASKEDVKLFFEENIAAIERRNAIICNDRRGEGYDKTIV